MNNKRNKLALGLTTLILLLTLTIGSAAPAWAGNADPTTDGLHGLLASPFNGGGSGT